MTWAHHNRAISRTTPTQNVGEKAVSSILSAVLLHVCKVPCGVYAAHAHPRLTRGQSDLTERVQRQIDPQHHPAWHELSRRALDNWPAEPYRAAHAGWTRAGGLQSDSRKTPHRDWLPARQNPLVPPAQRIQATATKRLFCMPTQRYFCPAQFPTSHAGLLNQYS